MDGLRVVVSLLAVLLACGGFSHQTPQNEINEFSVTAPPVSSTSEGNLHIFRLHHQISSTVPYYVLSSVLHTSANFADATILGRWLNGNQSETLNRNCLTARNISGTCVQRQYCEYSTYAIELTLYRPRSYRKPCAVDEVCCPFDFLSEAASMQNSPQDDEVFSFDADD